MLDHFPHSWPEHLIFVLHNILLVGKVRNMAIAYKYINGDQYKPHILGKLYVMLSKHSIVILIR